MSDKQDELDELVKFWNSSIPIHLRLPITLDSGERIDEMSFQCSYCRATVENNNCRGTITKFSHGVSVYVVTICDDCTGISLFHNVMETDDGDYTIRKLS